MSEDQIIGDIKKQFIRETAEQQRQVPITMSEVLGNISLAYHRGLSYGRELVRAEADGLIEALNNLIFRATPDEKENVERVIKTFKKNTL